MGEPPAVVLIIDADPASRNYLSVMLQKSGYEVLNADSAREGLVMAWKELPGAIILDPALSDMTAVELVTRLRQDRRTVNVPLVALSSRENQQEISALLSAGLNEYLVKSSQAVSKLIELLPRLLIMDVKPRKRGVLIAFLSAKGGTGTSSLCANLAMSLGSRQKDTKVAVIDLVLPIGSIANIVGYNESFNIVSASLQTPPPNAAFLSDHLPRISNWYLNLLAGSPDPDSANRLAIDRLENLVVAVQESYDYVFIDLGRALSRISLPIIQHADLIALILSTDLAAVVLSQIVWEYLKSHDVDQQHIYPILNRAVGLEGMTKAEAEQMLGLQIRVTIPYMGGNFTLSNNRHEPVISKFASDSSTLSLTQAATELAETAQKLRSR